jgi:hypothetical protein
MGRLLGRILRLGLLAGGLLVAARAVWASAGPGSDRQSSRRYRAGSFDGWPPVPRSPEAAGN